MDYGALAPTAYTAPKVAAPQGNAVVRALRALLIEHRLPYQLQTRLDRIAIRIGLREKTLRAAGLKIRVRRTTSDEAFVTNVIELREYTRDGFEIRAGDTVIDIGGNIGTFALLAAQRAKQVISIEPGSDNFALLTRNIRMNHATNLRAIHAAVCKEAGAVTLECSREGGYHSTTKGMLIGAVATETVKAVRLRDVFDEFAVDRCHFLKVDCEGAEYEIFESLPDGYLARVDKIAIEWHGVENIDERRIRANWLASRLLDRGFKLETYIEYTGFRSGMIRAVRACN